MSKQIGEKLRTKMLEMRQRSDLVKIDYRLSAMVVKIINETNWLKLTRVIYIEVDSFTAFTNKS